MDFMCSLYIISKLGSDLCRQILIWHFLSHPFVFVDVTCFSRSLSGKKDANFFTCSQVCRFVRRLSLRCFVGSSVPKDDNWDELLSLDLLSNPQLSSASFLQRLGFEDKVSLAAKHKAEADVCDKKSRDAVDKLAAKLKEDFAIMGREYLRYVLRNVLRHVSLTTELVKGLACFDPHMLFRLPLERPKRHFGILYRSFSSRRWVEAANEQLCQDEYLSFLGTLRTGYTTIVESPELVFDVVDLLMPMASLRERPHLHYLFKLCCLCLTGSSLEMPVVEIGSTNSNSSNCKIREAIFPVQSYVTAVPDCIQPCVTSSALAQFLCLRDELGTSGFTSLYDPWSSVDFNNHAAIYNTFRQGYASVLRRQGEAPAVSPVDRAPAKPQVSIAPIETVFRLDKGGDSSSTIAKAADNSEASGSKT